MSVCVDIGYTHVKMYKIILAFRYLLKRRISYFALFAVALCVFVMLVVMTVMNNLTSEFKEKVHRITADCVISSRSLAGFPYYEDFVKILEKQDIVEAVSPVIKSYAIVKTPQNEKTLKVVGIDPVLHDKTTGFSNFLYYHNFTDAGSIFTPTADTNKPAAIAGIAVLFERDSSGRYYAPDRLPAAQITVACFPLTAKGTLERAGTSVIASKTFVLGNVVQTGCSADWENIYLSFNDAQILCGLAGEPKRVSAIHIKFNKGVDIHQGCAKIDSLWQKFVEQKKDLAYANLFKNVKVGNWKDYNRTIIAVAETQQALMIIVFAMIGIITVFIVFVVFYMIVCHKSKDIGILKSVGASNGGLMAVFMVFAFFTGLFGSILGSLAGWRFLVHINQIEGWLFEHYKFQLWDRTIYLIGEIPNRIDLRVLVIIILSAIAACLLGAFIPSRQAAKLDAVKTLQVSRL
jgi:lipoprotein-releasing system permease protein